MAFVERLNQVRLAGLFLTEHEQAHAPWLGALVPQLAQVGQQWLRGADAREFDRHKVERVVVQVNLLQKGARHQRVWQARELVVLQVEAAQLGRCSELRHRNECIVRQIESTQARRRGAHTAGGCRWQAHKPVVAEIELGEHRERVHEVEQHVAQLIARQ